MAWTCCGPFSASAKPRGTVVRYVAPPTQFDREVATLCEMCVWRCGVRAKVKDDRVYKLDGNPFHPHSRGMLCPRGQAGIADRLRSGPPQVPAGPQRRARQRPVAPRKLG